MDTMEYHETVDIIYTCTCGTHVNSSPLTHDIPTLYKVLRAKLPVQMWTEPKQSFLK